MVKRPLLVPKLRSELLEYKLYKLNCNITKCYIILFFIMVGALSFSISPRCDYRLHALSCPHICLVGRAVYCMFACILHTALATGFLHPRQYLQVHTYQTLVQGKHCCNSPPLSHASNRAAGTDFGLYPNLGSIFMLISKSVVKKLYLQPFSVLLNDRMFY